MPFEWKTPFGYLFAFIVQFGSAYYLVKLVTFLLTFFVASCWTLMATTNDIKGHLNDFRGMTLLTATDDITENLNNVGEVAKSKPTEKELKEKLCEFITLDVDAKQ